MPELTRLHSALFVILILRRFPLLIILFLDMVVLIRQDIWKEAKQEARNPTLCLIWVAIEEELHRGSLQEWLEEECGATFTPDNYKRLKIVSVWQELGLEKQSC